MSQEEFYFEKPGRYLPVNSETMEDSELKSEHWIHVKYTLLPEHDCLEGHFDNFKLMPGAAQIGIVLDLLSEKIGRKVHLYSVRRAKFAAKWQPHTEVEISVNLFDTIDGFESIKWQIRDNKASYSSGVMLYS